MQESSELLSSSDGPVSGAELKLTLKNDRYARFLKKEGCEIIIDKKVDKNSFLYVMQHQFDPDTDYDDNGVDLVCRLLKGELKAVSDNAADWVGKKNNVYSDDEIFTRYDLFKLWFNLPEQLVGKKNKIEISAGKLKNQLLSYFAIDKKALNAQKKTFEVAVLNGAIQSLCNTMYKHAVLFSREEVKDIYTYSYSLTHKLPYPGMEQGYLYYLQALLFTLKSKLSDVSLEECQ